MKKILLTLGLALVANLGFSQRTIDWSVDQIVKPTVFNSTSTGTTFDYDIVLKNNGTDAVLATDTVAYQLSGLVGQNVVFAIPNGAFYVRPVGKAMASGDTMHLTGSFSITTYATFSFNFTFRAVSILLNRTSTGVKSETSTTNANNSLTSTITWFNPQKWGVSVNSVYTNNMSVYPNPATSSFTIALNAIDSKSDVQVTITDMSGRVVYSETKANANEFEINSANYAKGIYMVRVVNGDIISTSKVNIQ